MLNVTIIGELLIIFVYVVLTLHHISFYSCPAQFIVGLYEVNSLAHGKSECDLKKKCNFQSCLNDWYLQI